MKLPFARGTPAPLLPRLTTPGAILASDQPMPLPGWTVEPLPEGVAPGGIGCVGGGQRAERRVVMTVLERGTKYREAGPNGEVRLGSVHRWVQRYRERGNVRADPRRRPPSRIEPARALVFRLLKQRPKLTIPALRAALAVEGVTVSAATVQRFLARHGLQRKERLARGRR